jgi:hypothetical protein
MAKKIDADGEAVIGFLKYRAEHLLDRNFGREVLAGRAWLSYSPELIAKRVQKPLATVLESLHQLHDAGAITLAYLPNRNTVHDPMVRVRFTEGLR